MAITATQIKTYEFKDFTNELVEHYPLGARQERKNTNNDYCAMATSWEYMDDILGGTKRIREALWGLAHNANPKNTNESSYLFNYLPREPNEDKDDYRRRLMVATMTQYVGKTLSAFVGMVMRKPPMLTVETDSTEINEFFNNVNLEGDGIAEVINEALDIALTYGHGFFHADTTAMAGIKTKAEDNSRAFIQYIKPQNVLDWEFMNVGGVNRLVYAKLQLCKDSYKEMWYTGEWKRYRKLDDEYQLEAEGKADIIGIPLFPYYSKKIANFVSMPPLFEMAAAQVKDMQLNSQLDHGVKYISFAPFFGSGFEQSELETDAVGPNILLSVSNPQAKITQMPINSAGLEVAITVIDRNKAAIFNEGLSMLSAEAGISKTATEDNNDRAVETSSLVSTAMSIQKAFNNALDLVRQLEGWTEEVTIKVNTDVNLVALTAQEMAEYRNMVVQGLIDHETFLAHLKNGERLKTAKTSEEMQDAIAEDQTRMLGQQV